MDSTTIAKISKAQEYAQEPERMTFASFQVLFQGKHQTYSLVFDHGVWRCECDFFSQRGYCAHMMSVEKVIKRAGMVLQEKPAEA